MVAHGKFNFRNIQEMGTKIEELNLPIRYLSTLDSLMTPKIIGNFAIPNRLAIHPMEGCDGLADGNPSELTLRRYQRFGTSGAGIIWFEATAISQESKANPRQLMLTEENKNSFAQILRKCEIEEERLVKSDDRFGKALKILQLTHSGRYSSPGYKNPIRMYKYGVLDKAYHQTEEDGRLISDEELDALPDQYLLSIKLAKEIGFDGVDIKACHRYLVSESLSAFSRENSAYGGDSLEARTKLYLSIFDKAITGTMSPSFLISSRLNIYDGIPYPYGWGVVKIFSENAEMFTNRDEPAQPDLTEPIQLINTLYGKGVRLLNLSIANPYFNAFVSRPYDLALKGISVPNEHPLQGVARFLELTRQVKQNVPKDMNLIGTGYSWLRQFGPHVGAAEIEAGNVDFIGWGRMAFAHPTFGQQLIMEGKLNPRQVCMACSKCTELMRKKTVAGCVLRDGKTYLPYFKGEKLP